MKIRINNRVVDMPLRCFEALRRWGKNHIKQPTDIVSIKDTTDIVSN